MNKPTPAMIQAGAAAARFGADEIVSYTAVRVIWGAMEAARLEGERVMRQEALAARAEANRPWPVKGATLI